MKKIAFVVSVLYMLMVSCSGDKKNSSSSETSAEVSGLHPTEQKLDAFMDNYMSTLKAAISEQDDNTAIETLNRLSEEIVTQEKILKPEVEAWTKSLNKTEQDAFDARMENKPYMKVAFEMMADPALIQRLEKNPKFQEAFEKANSASTIFSKSDDDSE